MYVFVLNQAFMVVLIEENKEFLEEETKTFAPNSKLILATLKRNIGKRAVYDTYHIVKTLKL